MKKLVIIFLALVVFMAVPVFASTPEQENAPVMSEDENYDFEILNDGQLIIVSGDGFSSPADQSGPLTTQDLKDLGWVTYIRYEAGFTTDPTILLSMSIALEDHCDGTYTLTVQAATFSITVSGTPMGIESALLNLYKQGQIKLSVFKKLMTQLNSYL